MKIPRLKIIRLTMPFCVFILLFACSKDTDLLADYVVADVQEAKLLSGLVLDDYFISTTSGPMTLDVLSNDGFSNPENVKIVEITTPSEGTVVVNEDKTLTYTPGATSDETQQGNAEDTQIDEVQNTEGTQSTDENQNTEEVTPGPEQEVPTNQETQQEETQQKETPQEETQQEETPQEETQQEETQQEETKSKEETTAPQETEEETTDSFSYTTETTNDDETVTTQTGTVTVTTNKDYGTLKAFPTAYGAGSNATGGRGGSVYHVTNLNNSGSGSFRDAVSQSNRYIIFDVSGTVRLTSDLVIKSDNITIAGQTAPAGGIAITGPRVRFVDVDNMILRYVRFRPIWDHSQFDIEDALECTRVTNAMFDHISVSWGSDETLSFVGSKGTAPNKVHATYNITLQYSLIGDSAKGMISGFSNYRDTKTKGTPGGDFSIISNVWTHISHRFPNAVSSDRVDVINNVIHDWRNSSGTSNGPIKINRMNNYYQKGKQTNNVISKGKMYRINYRPADVQSVYAKGDIIAGEFNDPNASSLPLYHWWTSSPSGSTQGNPTGTEPITSSNSAGRFRSTPYPQINNAFTILTAEQAFATLPNEAGAYAVLDATGNKIIERDAVDTEFVSNVKTNTGIVHDYYQNRSKNSRYINYYNNVSSTPLNESPSGHDTDRDGMPNAWEIMRGFDPNKKDHNDDADGNGYTNLEEYLNLIDF